MRKIILTIEDEKTNQKMSATTTIDNINELYKKHKTNGITQLLFAINQELNNITEENVKILLPNISEQAHINSNEICPECGYVTPEHRHGCSEYYNGR